MGGKRKNKKKPSKQNDESEKQVAEPADEIKGEMKVKSKEESPKPYKKKITFNEDSEGSGPDAYEYEYTYADMVKTDFDDEFDLFRHFFRCLKKTGHIIGMIEQLGENNLNSPDELFERTTDVKKEKVIFKPIAPESGYNRKLLNASKKISLKYSPAEGRYLEARENISHGDVLIVESALIATDCPNSEAVQMKSYRCHHCTASVSYFITCRTCDICIFCSNECRIISWSEYHRWECYGLQRRFWFTQQPQYIAMRMMFYGAQYGFDFGGEEFQDDYEIDTENYGDPTNPYKYLYKLPCPLRKRSLEKLSRILLKCSEILVYLVEGTNFFRWLYRYPKYANMRLYDLYMFIGGILVRHYLQAEMNTIFINKFDEHFMFSDKIDYKSAAMFLVAPFLTNDCDPNVMWTFRDNEIVVKALTTIKPGTRLTVLWKGELGNKNCLCDYCCSTITAKNMYNALKCTNCRGCVLSLGSAGHSSVFTPFTKSVLFDTYLPGYPLKCIDCQLEHDLDEYKNCESEASNYVFTYKTTRDLESLLQAEKAYKLFLVDTHAFMCRINELLMNHYITGNLLTSFRYIQMNLGILESHWGQHSYRLMIKKSEYLMKVIARLKYFNTHSPQQVAQFCLMLHSEILTTAKFYCVDHRLLVDPGLLEVMTEVVKYYKTTTKASTKAD